MSEEKSRKHSNPIDLPSVMDRIGGDTAFLYELIDIFIEDFIGKYSKLKKAIERSDFRTIKEIGHSLKGSTGNLSLTGLYDTSKKMELSGNKEDIVNAKLHFIELNQEFEKLKNYLPVEKRLSIDQKWKGSLNEERPVLKRDEPEKNSEISILAADDSVPNQVLMTFYAKQAGFQIDIAQDGKEAVEFFRKKAYSIVFLDIHMPEMDGFEALNLMRRIEIENILPQTPIIALTGSTFREEGTTCLDAGFDDFIEKSSIHESLPESILKHVHSAGMKADKIKIDESILPLVPEYLEDRKEDVQKIRRALDKHNFSVIEDLGHKMKGSGKCYGFEKISMLGHRIETFAKQKNTAQIEESIGRMQDYLSTIRFE